MKYDDLFRLDGKVALITGSSKGIGRATAEAMAAQGAKVVISSRKLDVCEDVAQGIRDDGGDAVAIACNINEKPQLQALVDKTMEHFGRIDILVCNAAVNPYFGPMQDMPDEAYGTAMLLITGVYCVVGGMYSVVMNDLIQFVLKVIAAVAIAVIALILIQPESQTTGSTSVQE